MRGTKARRLRKLARAAAGTWQTKWVLYGDTARCVGFRGALRAVKNYAKRGESFSEALLAAEADIARGRP